MEKRSFPKTSPPPVVSHTATGAVPSHQLLAGRKEVLIQHAGEEYRLRITRLNKLILTK